MRVREPNKNGFTLIELSFAIAFLSVLLITITLITNEIVTLYRKGYSIKTINAVGRDLIDDFTSTLTESPSTSFDTLCTRFTNSTSRNRCERNQGQALIYRQFYDVVNITAGGSTSGDISAPVAGVFCTGKYSYIWNTGYTFGSAYSFADGESNSAHRLSLKDKDGKALSNFHLIKVEDNSRDVCLSSMKVATGTYEYPDPSVPASLPGLAGQHVFEFQEVSLENATELLSDSDTALALYDFVVFSPARVASTGRLFYSASFILATISGGVNIMSSSDFCQTDSYTSMDFSYCAINKFNFSTQASGSDI